MAVFSSTGPKIATGFKRIYLLEFYALKRQVDFFENQLATAQKEFRKNYEERYREFEDEEEREAYSEHMYDEVVALEETYPNLQWNAQFLVVYSLFEHNLNRLCQTVQDRSNFGLGFRDMAGQGIKRASAYLRKVASVETPFTETSWQTAMLLGDIRNVIAHRNGELESSTDANLIKRMEPLPGINVKPYFEGSKQVEIILSVDFVHHAVDVLYEVLKNVGNFELYGKDS